MNRIIFPELNLEFNISRVAFKLFGIETYWYAILIVMTLVLALIMFKKRDGLYEIKFNDIIDLIGGDYEIHLPERGPDPGS